VNGLPSYQMLMEAAVADMANRVVLVVVGMVLEVVDTVLIALRIVGMALIVAKKLWVFERTPTVEVKHIKKSVLI
jgi:hypothetical protein